MLTANVRAMRSVLPKHCTAERMSRVALGAIRQTPALAKCTPASLVNAVMQAAALGLEVNDGTGRAYLVPYKDEATLIVGYRGLLELAYRSGAIKSVTVREVYDGDRFVLSFGLEEKCEHVPGDSTDPAAITHVYAIIRYKDGGHHLEVMTRAQVDDIRKRSRAGQSGPWVTDYAMMSRKTVLRRALRYAPISVELQQAISVDEAYEVGDLSHVVAVQQAEPEAAGLSLDDVTPEREPGSEG
jgi:recombination protein RecT